MILFDTHAHMIDGRYDEDREELLKKMREEGLAGHIEVTAEADDLDAAFELSNTHRGVYLAVGIHPDGADSYSYDTEERIEEFCAFKKTVAIGEIGLDYHWGDDNKAAQQDMFIRQLELAKRLGKPVIIHSRDAAKDTLDILREHGGGRGVLHCFSGSVETAREVIAMGYYIGIGGTVTFKNNKKTVAVAREIPIERILLETDSPYLAPTPHRGERNMPIYTGLVAECIAEIRGITADEVAASALENAKKLFGIEDAELG